MEPIYIDVFDQVKSVVFPWSRLSEKKQFKINIMSVLKVIEILGNSTVSFDDALQNVVREASKTVKDIRSVYVQEMQVTVSNNEIAEYRVNTKVCFGIMDME